MTYDILNFYKENQDECPNCGARWGELDPQTNIYPHFTGECGKNINEALRGVALHSFWCGVCKETGVPCDFCIDYTFDARIPEVTAPPPAKKRSRLASWLIGMIAALVFWVMENDVRSCWWVWMAR